MLIKKIKKNQTLSDKLFLDLPLVPTNNDLLNPSYQACECDLTANICDINCCCDSSCTTFDKITFRPVCRNERPVIIDKQVDEWYCVDTLNKSKLLEPNWFPIICINVNLNMKILPFLFFFFN